MTHWFIVQSMLSKVGRRCSLCVIGARLWLSVPLNVVECTECAIECTECAIVSTECAIGCAECAMEH